MRDANLLTAFHLAHEAGFDAVEISVPKLTRFLEDGFSVEDIRNALEANQLVPVCINDIFGVESMRPEERKRIFREMEYLAPIAQAIGCKTIQVCPLCELSELSWPEAARMTAKNIRTLADIAAGYNVRVQLETMAWAPIHSLKRGLAVLQETQRDNVGLSVDYWHFWAPGETTPEEVAALNPDLICNVHFCDGKKPFSYEAWEDETVLRAYYPGEGDIPLQVWTDAVKSTGYDGAYSIELISAKHWEYDIREVVSTLFKRMSAYLD